MSDGRSAALDVRLMDIGRAESALGAYGLLAAMLRDATEHDLDVLLQSPRLRVVCNLVGGIFDGLDENSDRCRQELAGLLPERYAHILLPD
jgi:hypothetical protein